MTLFKSWNVVFGGFFSAGLWEQSKDKKSEKMHNVAFWMKEVGHRYFWEYSHISSSREKEHLGPRGNPPLVQRTLPKRVTLWQIPVSVTVFAKPSIHYTNQGTGVKQCSTVLLHLTPVSKASSAFFLQVKINIFPLLKLIRLEWFMFFPMAKQPWQLSWIAHSAPLCHDLFVL